MCRKQFGRLFAALCLLIALAVFASSAMAEAAINCQIGYNNTVTFLRTLPVTVEVTNNGADASGTLQIEVMRGNIYYDIYETPLAVASGATARATVPVELTYRQNDFVIRWVADGQTIAEERFKPSATVDPSTLLIGVLSDTGKSLSHLDITQYADPFSRMEYWRAIPVGLSELPADVESMRFFDVLVVDGVDMNALAQPQKDALDGWLSSGGIVIVGGGAQAASAFPYFTKYTGISAGAVTDGGDVSQLLLTALKSGQKSAGGSAKLCELKGASGVSVGVDARLVDIADVGSGKVLTSAFSLSDEPLAAWQGRNALWQSIFVSYMNDAYSGVVSSRGTNTRYSGMNNDYIDSSIIDSIAVPNSRGAALPMVLLGVFVLCVGFGGYLLLKRFDKREWLWAVIPALALCFSLGLWALSGSIGIHKPVAAHFTVARVDENGNQSAFTGVIAAQPKTGQIRFSADEGFIDPTPGASYYEQYYDEGETEQAKRLRYTYHLGRESGVSMTSDATWEQVSFAVNDAPIGDIGVSGECALDGGDLLFTVRNEGGVSFDDGVIITDYGFVSVPALAAGQTITARLTPPADPNKPIDEMPELDGVYISDGGSTRYSTYDFINAYTGGVRKKLGEGDKTSYLRSSVLNYLSSSSGWNSLQGNMRYIAFAEGLCPLKLRVDGEPVTRVGSYGAIDVMLSYDPIAKDGSVKFLRGSFPMYNAEVDKQDKPLPVKKISAASTWSRYDYFRLSELPTFGFDMSALPDNFQLDGFRLVASYAYYSYKVSLYNVKTSGWDAITTWTFDPAKNAGIEKTTIDSVESYINSDGMLYARFEKMGNADEYAEISLPSLTMDGRVK